MGILVAFRQPALQYDFKLAFTANALKIFNILKLLFNTVDLSLLSFIPAKEVLRFDISEKDDVIQNRIINLKAFVETGQNNFSPDEISLLKETFGSQFLTENYHLPIR